MFFLCIKGYKMEKNHQKISLPKKWCLMHVKYQSSWMLHKNTCLIKWKWNADTSHICLGLCVAAFENNTINIRFSIVKSNQTTTSLMSAWVENINNYYYMSIPCIGNRIININKIVNLTFTFDEWWCRILTDISLISI